MYLKSYIKYYDDILLIKTWFNVLLIIVSKIVLSLFWFMVNSVLGKDWKGLVTLGFEDWRLTIMGYDKVAHGIVFILLTYSGGYTFVTY